MAHPAIEEAKKAPLHQRKALLMRAQDIAKADLIKEGKRRAAKGEYNWGTQYRGTEYKTTPTVHPYKHYADKCR